MESMQSKENLRAEQEIIFVYHSRIYLKYFVEQE